MDCARAWKAGSVKLNADGAVAKTANKGAIGVVCRSEDGHYLGTSVVVLAGVTEPATLEAHACREALPLAEDLHVNKINVATDCLRVVNELRDRVFLGPYGMILRDILNRATSFQKCSFCFEQRECNSEPHALARMATSFDVGSHVWLDDLPDTCLSPLF